MKTIGIDLGLSKSSFGSVWEQGDKMISICSAESLEELFIKVNEWEQGSLVVVEKPFLGRNVKFHSDFSVAIGRLQQFCYENGYKFYSVPAQTWQTQLLGVKARMGTDKRKIASFNTAYGLTISPLLKQLPCKKRKTNEIDIKSSAFDLADAICIGYWGLRNVK